MPATRQTPSTKSCVVRPKFATTETVARSCQARRSAARRAAQAPLGVALDEAVLRRVHERVEPLEQPHATGRVRHRLRRLAVLAAVEPLDVVVDGEHERQARERERRRPTSGVRYPSAAQTAASDTRSHSESR